MKNRREIEQEIKRLEKRLEDDKHDIKDNLKPSHLLSGLIPKAFRVDDRVNNFDDYIKSVASTHITPNEPGIVNWFDRVRQFLGIGKKVTKGIKKVKEIKRAA